MTHDYDREFDALLSKLIEDEACNADLRSLGHLLEGNSSHQRQYFDWVSTHLLLEREGALRAEVEHTPHPLGGSVRPPKTRLAKASRASQLSRRSSKNKGLRYLLAAAVLLVAGGILVHRAFQENKVAMATVVDAIGIVGGPEELTSEGSVLDVGLPLRFQSGVISIAMPSGAKFTLEGPASLVVEGTNHVRLDEGKLYAKVPRSGVGFTVDTETGSLVDLGTEFGVVADRDGSVDTYVYVGQVRAESAGSAATLKAGMAVTVPAGGGLGRVRTFDQADTRFTRTIDGADYVAAVERLEPLYMLRFSPNSKLRLFSSVGGKGSHAVSLRGGVYASAGGPIATPLAADGCLRFVGVESTTEVDSVQSSLEKAAAYTIVLWVRVDERGPQGLAAFTSERGPDVDLGPLLRVTSDGHLEHRCYAADGSGSGFATQRSNAPLKKGEWVQVVASGGSFRELNLYVNGEVAAAPVTMSSAIRTDCGRLALGSGSGRSREESVHTGPLRGAIDEVVVFDRCLTKEEVRNLYQLAINTMPRRVP